MARTKQALTSAIVARCVPTFSHFHIFLFISWWSLVIYRPSARTHRNGLSSMVKFKCLTDLRTKFPFFLIFSHYVNHPASASRVSLSHPAKLFGMSHSAQATRTIVCVCHAVLGRVHRYKSEKRQGQWGLSPETQNIGTLRPFHLSQQKGRLRHY